MKVNKQHLAQYLWKSFLGITIVSVAAAVLSLCTCGNGQEEADGALVSVRYGITPYQDSALPVVADRLGWYEAAGIDFKLVPLAWGDVMTALSSGAIDVAIYNLNSFLPPYENAATGKRKPIFYSPTYVFKGQAIMVHGDAGFQLFRDIVGESPEERSSRLAEVARQLMGKRIAITEGTELEQIVLEALSIAGLDGEKDVTLIHALPDDALAAFLSKNIDAFAAGLTERTEARRHGGTELLVTSDVTLPVIDGVVTTTDFAEQREEILDSLLQLWFRTIRFMKDDVAGKSEHILGYLTETASTRYSPEEYEIAWSFNVFPATPEEAHDLFHSADSPYFWKKSWDSVNTFLIETDKITKPVSYSVYWGDKALSKLAHESE